MDFKQLEAFVWIVRLGSFTAAANKLNTTQPAITTRIRQLEGSLKTKLFEEPRRSATLTQRGRDLVEYAERILSLAFEAHTKIGDPSAVQGRLRIGVGEAIALAWFPDLIAKLNMEFPDLMVESEIDLTAGLWGKLNTGELDLLLLPGPSRFSNLEVRDIGSTEFTWMASPKLGLPDDRLLMPGDLDEQPVITLSKESILYQIMVDWFNQGGFRPRKIDICNSMATIASLTISGLGISLLPSRLYQSEIENGSLIRLKIEPKIKPINFICAYKKSREASLLNLVSNFALKTSTF